MANWIAGAIKHKGAFTAKAKAAGMTTKGYAKKVLKKGSHASAETQRQANLAQTLGEFKHHPDGTVDHTPSEQIHRTE